MKALLLFRYFLLLYLPWIYYGMPVDARQGKNNNLRQNISQGLQPEKYQYEKYQYIVRKLFLPQIPSPSELIPIIPRPGGRREKNKSSDKNISMTGYFPQKKVRLFLDKLESIANVVNKEIRINKLKHELQTIFKIGQEYRFGSDCPLILESNQQKKNNFLTISCLSGFQRKENIIKESLKSKRSLWLRLSKTIKKRKIIGVLLLTGAQINKGRLEWNWVDKGLRYQNRYLHLLHSLDPSRPESFLLNEKNISRRIAPLLKAAIESDSNKSDNDLKEILTEGQWIRFNSSCPLIVKEKPIEEKGVRRIELRLDISCIKGHSMADVRLLLPPGYKKRLAAIKNPGIFFGADLRFGRFFRKDNQFYMLWDSIKNVRVHKKGTDRENSF